MWCLETINEINQKSAQLAREGRPTKDAMAKIGIAVNGNTPKEEQSTVLVIKPTRDKIGPMPKKMTLVKGRLVKS